MALSFDLSVDQPRLFEDLEERAQNFKPVLKRWAGFLKAQSRAKFEGGLAPLAQSTLEKYQHTRTSKVTAAGKVRTSYAKNLARQLRRREGGRALNAALERLKAGDLSADTGGNKALARLQKALGRAAEGKRVGGDRRKSAGHKILGKLIGALVGSISGDTATVKNAARFSKVQNEGGPVGHGAVLPARTTLEVTQADAAVLAEIVVDHLLGGDK